MNYMETTNTPTTLKPSDLYVEGTQTYRTKGKLTKLAIAVLKKEYREGSSISQLAAKYGLATSTTHYAVTRRPTKRKYKAIPKKADTAISKEVRSPFLHGAIQLMNKRRAELLLELKKIDDSIAYLTKV